MKNFSFQKHGDRLLFVLAVGVLAILVILYLGRTKSQTAVPSIVFTQWWNEYLERDTLTALAEEFESLHGNIRVILNTKSYEELQTELFNTANAGGSPVLTGDLIALDPLWAAELIKRGLIEAEEEPSEPPVLSFINVLHYNVDILREAGFIRPPKDRNEFITYAMAVTDKDAGRWALSMGINSSRGIYDDIYPWIWAAGAQLLIDGRPNINSRPVIESLSFLASLDSQGFIAPGAFSADNNRKLDDFIHGRAVFMISPARDIGFIRERMGDEAFDITSIPAPVNYAGNTYLASADWTLGIHSASTQKEAARLFSAFLAGNKTSLSANSKAIPAGLATLSGADPFYLKVWDISIAGETAQDFSGLTGIHELEEIFREELAALFAGSSSPADTAAAIQERWEIQLKP